MSTLRIKTYSKSSQTLDGMLAEFSEKRPKFIVGLNDKVLNLRLREYVELKVKLEPQNDVTMQVKWFRNDLPVVVGQRLSIYYNYGYAHLTIRGFEEKDAGIYTCVATNEYGSSKSNAVLNLDHRFKVCEDKLKEATIKKILKIKDTMRKAEEEDLNRKIQRDKKEAEAKSREKLISSTKIDNNRSQHERYLTSESLQMKNTKLSSTSQFNQVALISNTAKQVATKKLKSFSPSLRRHDLIISNQQDTLIWRPYQELNDSILSTSKKNIIETICEYECELLDGDSIHIRSVNQDNKSTRTLPGRYNVVNSTICSNSEKEKTHVGSYQELEDIILSSTSRSIIETMLEYEPLNDDDDTCQSNPSLQSNAGNGSNYASTQRLDREIAAIDMSQLQANDDLSYSQLEDSIFMILMKNVTETINEYETSEEVLCNMKGLTTKPTDAAQDSHSNVTNISDRESSKRLEDEKDMVKLEYKESEDSVMISTNRSMSETIIEYETPHLTTAVVDNLEWANDSDETLDAKSLVMIEPVSSSQDNAMIRFPYVEREDMIISNLERRVIETINERDDAGGLMPDHMKTTLFGFKAEHEDGKDENENVISHLKIARNNLYLVEPIQQEAIKRRKVSLGKYNEREDQKLTKTNQIRTTDDDQSRSKRNDGINHKREGKLEENEECLLSLEIKKLRSYCMSMEENRLLCFSFHLTRSGRYGLINTEQKNV